MKKNTLLTFLMCLIVMGLNAQNLEVVGKAKITMMDTVTVVSANVVRQSDGTLALRQYKIGDMAQGGIVFYVDESGEHGLVADTADISTGIQWYNGAYKVTNATGDGVGSGEMNTMLIIAQQTVDNTAGNFAALLCANLVRGSYGDWYLPSKDELDLMWKNLHRFGCSNEVPDSSTCLTALGGFESAFYWSSTEDDSVLAWKQVFGDGNQVSSDKIDSG